MLYLFIRMFLKSFPRKKYTLHIYYSNIRQCRLLVLPVITIVAIPIRLIEFIVKFARTNPPYTLPYGLLMALPYVSGLTLVFSTRLILLLFAQPTILIHQKYTVAHGRLDVDHGSEWMREHWLTRRAFEHSTGDERGGQVHRRITGIVRVRYGSIIIIITIMKLYYTNTHSYTIHIYTLARTLCVRLRPLLVSVVCVSLLKPNILLSNALYYHAYILCMALFPSHQCIPMIYGNYMTPVCQTKKSLKRRVVFSESDLKDIFGPHIPVSNSNVMDVTCVHCWIIIIYEFI
jgi:hypothetical protein